MIEETLSRAGVKEAKAVRGDGVGRDMIKETLSREGGWCRGTGRWRRSRR